MFGQSMDVRDYGAASLLDGSELGQQVETVWGSSQKPITRM